MSPIAVCIRVLQSLNKLVRATFQYVSKQAIACTKAASDDSATVLRRWNTGMLNSNKEEKKHQSRPSVSGTQQ
eukprot:5164562-Amphidinium_carterae.2